MQKKELDVIPLQLPNVSYYMNYSGCLVAREARTFIRSTGVGEEDSSRVKLTPEQAETTYCNSLTLLRQKKKKREKIISLSSYTKKIKYKSYPRQ